jgi:hypothetical protein
MDLVRKSTILCYKSVEKVDEWQDIHPAKPLPFASEQPDDTKDSPTAYPDMTAGSFNQDKAIFGFQMCQAPNE